MSDREAEAVLRRFYEAYAVMDLVTIEALMPDDLVVHVSGHHPLSGDYRGREAIWGYFGKVVEISGGTGGFEVHAITADENGHGVALLTGTIREFVRPVIHVVHVREGQIAALWDAYLDARAEDEFWTTAMQA